MTELTYRCRRCQVVFAELRDINEEPGGLLRRMIKAYPADYEHLSMQSVHNCQDDIYGVADLIGAEHE